MRRCGCCRGGRFVEMGKTDIRDPAEVAAGHPGWPTGRSTLNEPGRIGSGGCWPCWRPVRAGVLVPLPVACWDVRRAPEAFRYLSQARHPASRADHPGARRDGTVLVTGASGALGGLVARHLAASGPAGTWCWSRGRAGRAGTAALAAGLAGAGAGVQVACLRCGRPRRPGRGDRGVPAALPLRGVVHAAGVLDDGVIGSLTAGAGGRGDAAQGRRGVASA